MVAKQKLPVQIGSDETAIIIDPALLDEFISVRQADQSAAPTVSPQAALHSDSSAEAGRSIKVHDIKCWPEYFHALADGLKTFELRKNDRDYRVCDLLRIHLYDPDHGHATGIQPLMFEISYMLADERFGLRPGYSVLGLRDVRAASTSPGVKSAEGAMRSEPPCEGQPDTSKALSEKQG
jgi:hypothetical protein